MKKIYVLISIVLITFACASRIIKPPILPHDEMDQNFGYVWGIYRAYPMTNASTNGLVTIVKRSGRNPEIEIPTSLGTDEIYMIKLEPGNYGFSYCSALDSGQRRAGSVGINNAGTSYFEVKANHIYYAGNYNLKLYVRGSRQGYIYSVSCDVSDQYKSFSSKFNELYPKAEGFFKKSLLVE